jgi:methylglutaconyl-CoA hydratase
MAYQFLSVRREGPVEHLTLNRPDVRNAFNEVVIAELAVWARAVRDDRGVRVVVLRGAGQVFSAGADANWMAKTIDYSHGENLRDAWAVADMFMALDSLPVALVGSVHGAALGGGAGLAAVCDIVVAEEATVFGFTETKLGILPAVISPYVLAKIGPSAARELFLTGMRFDARRAREIGLIHSVIPAAEREPTVERYVRELLSAAPTAVAAAKALIPKVWGRSPAEARNITAEAIAAQRVSPQGQEGLRSFLQKSKPSWMAEV